MNASKFNALVYANKLEAAGVPPAQAQVHALALAEVLDTQMVTKADLEAVNVGLNARIDAVESRVYARIAASEARMEENLAQFEARMELKFEKQFAELQKQFGEFKNDVIKWFAILSVSQIGITTTITALIVHAR